MRFVHAALLAASALISVPALAQPISYQGRITSAGESPVGLHEVRFRVFDAPSGGSQVGTQLVREVNMTASDEGVFVFNDLDFGPGVFNGQPRWMELAVRANGAGAFTTLNPRQPLTATPHAVWASGSGTTLHDAFLNGRVIHNAADAAVQITGKLEIGNPLNNGVFQLFQNNSTTPIILFSSLSGQGGSIRMRNEQGQDIIQIEADHQGTGSQFRMFGNGSQFYFDGDLGLGPNTGSTLTLTGPVSSFGFDTSVSGNAAVSFPPGSIGPAERFADTGLASVIRTQGVSLTGSIANVTHRTITVPAPGYVVAIATCNIGLQRTTGIDGVLTFGLSEAPNTLPGSSRAAIRLVRTNASPGPYDFPGVVHTVFDVPTAGQYTFYFNANSVGFVSPSITNTNLSLIYVPTVYGDVSTSLAHTPSGGDMPPGPPVTNEQILSEQLAEQHRALQAMREEQASMRRQMEELRARLPRD